MSDKPDKETRPKKGKGMLVKIVAGLGLVGVGVPDLLEQVSHDAAHGGEVVNDQEFHRGGHGSLRGRKGSREMERAAHQPPLCDWDFVTWPEI